MKHLKIIHVPADPNIVTAFDWDRYYIEHEDGSREQVIITIVKEE